VLFKPTGSGQEKTSAVERALIDEDRSRGQEAWEAAYSRFETDEQEVRKFVGRLRQMGAEEWPRNSEIVELFCGRGNGLRALDKLGFTRLEGVDLSASLLEKYKGPGTCYRCDCRQLPFRKHSKDVVTIHGGLHHLSKFPEDLDATLSEIYRILRDGGLFGVVEPWLTPFLSLVHVTCRSSIARRLSTKIDALATMIQYERNTYEQWLRQPQTVLELLEKYFWPTRLSFGWGKVMFVGMKRRPSAG
jgi:ubiquinone/menaquinone biosynthesis C-methylase UbiE